MRVNLCTNVQKSQIREVKDGIWQILGIPMTVDNAVMNGIYYPENENAKGLNSYRDNPITLRHPKDDSAKSGRGLIDHFSGGIVINTYNHNGINYADAEFKESLMLGQDNGEYYVNKIKKGEPIGVSTGLYFDGNNVCGKAKNGEEYHATAINQVGDHIALLPDDEPPAGGDATFIRFNGENDDQTINVDIDEFIESLATNSEKTLLTSIKEWCKQTFAPKEKIGDNTSVINKDEVDAMRETLIAALKDKGITVNAEITDAELLAKYNEANTPDVSAAVNAAIKPLTEKLTSMEAALNAEKDKELDALAENAAKHLKGFDKETLKAMGADKIHKALAENGVAVGGPNATNAQSPKERDSSTINMTPWEDK